MWREYIWRQFAFREPTPLLAHSWFVQFRFLLTDIDPVGYVYVVLVRFWSGVVGDGCKGDVVSCHSYVQLFLDFTNNAIYGLLHET